MTPLPAAAVTEGELILVTGLLLAAGIASALVADRIRVPALLLFLGLGMLVGSDGIGGVEFDDVELTRTVGVVGLALILFDGGLTAGWREIRPVVGTAISLATLGTLLTALIAGGATYLIFDFGLLESLIVGSAIATTDSAAIFAVLRGSTLRRRLARALEGESGMNDPVAILLVTGFIDWSMREAYGLPNMAGLFVAQLGLGAAFGLAIGLAGRGALRRLSAPTAGLYPVASVGLAALSFGLADVAGGSGFLAVYLTGLVLGTGRLPGRDTMVAFHTGTAWVAQIGFFFVLGLLVLPSELLAVAGEALLISAILIFVARPVAAALATLAVPYSAGERAMLGWAGLKGAIPIWLATLPVIAGVANSEQFFNIVFFVVVTSTLVQGATFERLARRLGLTTSVPAVPPSLLESGTIRQLGGEVLAYRVPHGAAIDGLMVKELGLPRSALVSVIVRSGEALAPRGSTVVQSGDEMHVLVRGEDREEVAALTERWHTGPIGPPPTPPSPPRSTPSVLSVGPWEAAGGDPSRPHEVAGRQVVKHLRTRRDEPGSLVQLDDGRYAVTAAGYFAVGGRRQLARWCRRRAPRETSRPEARAWWQEVIGALGTR